MNLFEAKRPVVASQTLAKIAAFLEHDQGARFRGLQKKYIPLMNDAFDDSPHEPRSHLGASLIGRECSREIWFSWRWAESKKAPAKMIRLWNRGHLEEGRMLALLEMIECQVWHQTEDGNQFRIQDYRGHAGGGIDAVVRGIPEMPDVAMLGEFKTHNEKSFAGVEDKGVRASKFEHFVQMCVYMKKLNLTHALYIAVNKNTDELYAEIVELDHDIANRYLERFKELIDANTIPKRISESPAFWKCKFCDFSQVCFKKLKPRMNCRTCAFSQVGDNGQWHCSKHKTVLTKVEQMAGCSGYTLHSAME